MKTKYKLENEELVLNIDFWYDIGFKENDLSHIYKYINRFLEQENLKFEGRQILLYVNGIFLGTLYLSNYYLKKFFKIRKGLLSDINSYFLPSLILELEHN